MCFSCSKNCSNLMISSVFLHFFNTLSHTHARAHAHTQTADPLLRRAPFACPLRAQTRIRRAGHTCACAGWLALLFVSTLSGLPIPGRSGSVRSVWALGRLCPLFPGKNETHDDEVIY